MLLFLSYSEGKKMSDYMCNFIRYVSNVCSFKALCNHIWHKCCNDSIYELSMTEWHHKDVITNPILNF